MLTELLFSLSGHSSLFSSDSDANYDFLHPGEREILSQLLNLGRYAKFFQKFVDDFDLLALTKTHLTGAATHVGYYESAFAEGVKSILSDYRSDLVKLETNFRTTPTCRNLLYINAELVSYFLIFPAIEEALKKILDGKVRGCALLNLIYENLSNGIPAVSKSFDKIRRSCNFLFANQLIEWLKFGSVVDKYNEFFIQKYDNDKFIIRPEFCPVFLTANQVEKLFFIGEKIPLVLKEKKSLKSVETLSNLVDEMCKEVRSILIDIEFDPVKLDRPIERIRKSLSELLWSSISSNLSQENDGDSLYYCLNILKDYYFLGKGEFFVTLIDEIDETVCRQNRDLNKLLLNSFVKVYGGDGATIFNDVFKMKFVKNDDVTTSDLHGNCLDLTLKTSDKLKLIFDDDTLAKCRRIFHFLFKIRRVQIALHKSWMNLLKNRSSRKSSSVVVEAKVWRVNNLMIFLVNNLQYYLHVDVFDSYYRDLHNELSNNVNEFQRVSELITEFVRNVGVSCFLENKNIDKIVDGVLNDCEKFASMMTTDVDESDVSTKMETLQTIYVAYERHSSLLFRLLSTPKTHSSNPNLSQLLQRLDFNSYFSSTNLF